MFCHKSVFVRANLATDDLNYKLVRPNEFGQGLWNICISSVSYDSNLPLNFQAYVTCNVVTEKTFNESYELINYEQPLATFYFETNPPRSSRKQVKFDPMWFPINSPHEDIIFTVWDLSTSTIVKANCEVIFNVLFQNLRP